MVLLRARGQYYKTFNDRESSLKGNNQYSRPLNTNKLRSAAFCTENVYFLLFSKQAILKRGFFMALLRARGQYYKTFYGRESSLKGKNQYSRPPIINKLRSAAFCTENVYFLLFSKQAILKMSFLWLY
jgi:hypothetical protein